MLTWVGRFQCFFTMKTPTKTPISSAKPPNIHRLSASRALLPSAAASSPKIFAKQSCKHSDKEGQSLNCSDFSYTIKECVYFVIHPSKRVIWRDDILMGTADRISRGDIDLSYLIVFRWKTSEDPEMRTELILILFLLLRGKKCYVILKAVIYQHVILESEESKSTTKNISHAFNFAGMHWFCTITCALYQTSLPFDY